MKARLAFDTQAEGVEESYVEVAAELGDYARKASAYLDQHGIELRRAVTGLEKISRQLAERQDFYGARLRQFAAQLESGPSEASAQPAQTLLELRGENDSRNALPDGTDAR